MGGGTEPAAVWQASTLRAGLVGCCRPQDHPAAPDGLALPADINECVTDLHTCSRREHCVNTVGSFHCYKALTCEPGYRLEDGECTGEEGWLQALPRPSPCPAAPPPYPAPPLPSPRPSHVQPRPLTLPCPNPLACSAPPLTLLCPAPHHAPPHPSPCPAPSPRAPPPHPALTPYPALPHPSPCPRPLTLLRPAPRQAPLHPLTLLAASPTGRSELAPSRKFQAPGFLAR